LTPVQRDRGEIVMFARTASVLIGLAALGTWLTAATPVSAEPVVIASIAIDSQGGFPVEFENGNARFTLGMFPVSSVQLFSDRTISAASVGTTLVANGGNDADFPEIARQMTNGRGNYIEWIFGPSAGGGGGVGAASEGALFNLPAGIPDFRGFVLNSLTLRVDAFSSGPDPNEPGFARHSFQGRLAVVGTGAFDPSPVPEPATLTLVTTGVFGLVGAWCRGRRRHMEG
jgi:hypothetical protein